MKHYLEEKNAVISALESTEDGLSAAEAQSRLEKNGKNILFPAVKGVVVKVDIPNQKLIVNKQRFLEVAVD